MAGIKLKFSFDLSNNAKEKGYLLRSLGTVRQILKTMLPVFLAVLLLAGCGTTTSLDNPFKQDPVRINTVTVYVPEQQLSIPTAQTSSFPAGWETNPDSVVTPKLGALVGSTPNNLNETLENGTSETPYNNTTLFYNYQLTANPVFLDPNAWVKSASNQTYNLAWGTLDVDGPGFVLNYDSSDSLSYQVSAPETLWNKTLTGSTIAQGPKLTSPGNDVLSAWAQGWTGEGTGVLVIDGSSSQTGDPVLDNHGIFVARIINQYAPGATVFFKDFDTTDYLLPSAPRLLDGTASGLVGSNALDIVNLSIDLEGLGPFLNSTLLSILKGQAGFVYEGVDLTNTTVTVAAGNDSTSLTTETLSLPYALVRDAVTLPRTLIVGAITADVVTGSRTLATYSNTPGTDTTLQNRFLLASGQASWVDGSFAVDGIQISAQTTQGTSFAAPRVAAYASILRQKFPNISGEQAASILLDTATTEGLACFPSCAAETYGRGLVSLPRALAPVGRLR